MEIFIFFRIQAETAGSQRVLYMAPVECLFTFESQTTAHEIQNRGRQTV
jgi:hypothetical protein